MLIKNQLAELTIRDISSDGNGVGRVDGVAVFVPRTAVGDRLNVKIVSVRKNFAYGIVESIIEPSPDRIEPVCPFFGRCGGCDFQHIAYSAELSAKRNFVSGALSRIGGITVPTEPVIGSPLTERYRNKAQFPVSQDENGLFYGLYAPRSHRVVRIGDCLLQPSAINEAAAFCCAELEKYSVSAYDENTREGLLRHIYIRQAKSGLLMVCLVLNGDKLPHEKEFIADFAAKYGGSTLCVNINRADTNVILGSETRCLCQPERMTDMLCGVPLSLSPHSFLQVNRDAAQLLYQAAADMTGLSGNGVLLDLYCGAGSIGLSMAGRWSRLIGVESVPQSVEDARVNARRAGIDNTRFICADAGEAAATLASEGLKPDVIITDPPRKGCSAEAIEAMLALAPGTVVMVSCDPATLARDLKALCAGGYALEKVQPVDMFPRTANVECAVRLARR